MTELEYEALLEWLDNIPEPPFVKISQLNKEILEVINKAPEPVTKDEK